MRTTLLPWFALGLVLPMSYASAAPAIGEIEATGEWEIEGGATLTLDAIGAYLARTEGLRVLEARAAEVRVERYHTTSADATLVAIAPTTETSSYVVTNATILLDGAAHGGWLGVYVSDATTTSLAAQDKLAGTAAAPTSYGNGAHAPTEGPAPDVRAYSVTAHASHLALRAAGELRFSGDVMIKLQGPDLIVSAHENDTRVRSGQTRSTTSPLVVEDDWAFLTLKGAELVLASADPFEIPVRDANARWQGQLFLQGASGTIETPTTTYATQRRSVLLDGEFTADFAPTSDRSTLVRLDGDLAATTLTPAVRVAPVSDSAWVRWMPWTIAVAAVAASGTTYLVMRRGGGLLRSPEEHAHRASLAAEAGAFDDALRWTEAALRIAPRSSRLLADRGFFQEQLGDHEAALASYAAASREGNDGEAEYLAFRLARRLGLTDEADDWIVRALDRAPTLSLELEEGDEERSDRVRAAIRRARASLRD